MGHLLPSWRRRCAHLALAAVVAAVGTWAGSTQAAIGYGRFSTAAAGYDISWPQCDQPLPGEHTVGVVGVTGGRPFSQNPCLHAEYTWALDRPQRSHVLSTPAVYMNLDFGQRRTGARDCEAWDLGCQAYNYGYAAAAQAVAYAERSGAYADVWWLDVETENAWSDREDLNDHVIQGAVDRLHQGGALVGFYSTPKMWGVVTGTAYSPGLPVWVAGPLDLSAAPAYCSRDHAFGGGTVWMVQYPSGEYDGDYAC